MKSTITKPRRWRITLVGLILLATVATYSMLSFYQTYQLEVVATFGVSIYPKNGASYILNATANLNKPAGAKSSRFEIIRRGEHIVGGGNEDPKETDYMVTNLTLIREGKIVKTAGLTAPFTKSGDYFAVFSYEVPAVSRGEYNIVISYSANFNCTYPSCSTPFYFVTWNATAVVP